MKDIQDFEEREQDSFSDFIKSMTEDKANDNAVCGLDGSQCDSCGS